MSSSTQQLVRRAVSPSAATAKRPRGRPMSDKQFALVLILPAAAFLTVFVAWPLVKLVIDSFYDIAPLAGTRRFVGLGNYTDALTSSDFLHAALRTLGYTLIVVTLEFALGLGAALLFNGLGQRSRVLRTVFLYPLMIAPVVAGLLWRFLLIDNFGLVNALLTKIGVLDSPADIGWLSDPDIVLASVSLPDIWLTTSFMTLVLFAGLQNIPGDILEAARLDGAGARQQLFRIILPLLRPVIAVALIVRGIDAARAFDTIVIQTNGGPQSASTTLSLLIYRTTVRFGEQGLASAMATLYLLAMLTVAFLTMRMIWRPGKGQS
ncbi:sugar ABC transporter permease [Streptomyces sp. NPDC004546]|uniref:carbohydrate ABC transporter permease n=1 Tax=unclassified Streptomyces TaxID=2593676 RepID=UPI0033A80B67